MRVGLPCEQSVGNSPAGFLFLRPMLLLTIGTRSSSGQSSRVNRPFIQIKHPALPWEEHRICSGKYPQTSHPQIQMPATRPLLHPRERKDTYWKASSGFPRTMRAPEIPIPAPPLNFGRTGSTSGSHQSSGPPSKSPSELDSAARFLWRSAAVKN